jgi:hypothetical protein
MGDFALYGPQMGQVRCTSINKGDSKTPGHPDALLFFEKHHHKVMHRAHFAHFSLIH